MRDLLSLLNGGFVPGWVALMACLLAGCGNGSNNGYKGPRGKVSGTVTIAGTAAPPGAQILFQGASEGYIATGEIQEGGHYDLVYQGSHQIPAVDYLVQLSPPPSQLHMDTAVSARPVVQAAPVFPVKNQSVTTSHLSFSVKAGENTASFDLEK